jgi:hypothetical protein
MLTGVQIFTLVIAAFGIYQLYHKEAQEAQEG